jgi:hypothetical protein
MIINAELRNDSKTGGVGRQHQRREVNSGRKSTLTEKDLVHTEKDCFEKSQIYSGSD